MLSLDLSFYNATLFKDYLLKGLLFSLELTIIATIGGIFFGTLLALMRLSSIPLFVGLSKFYINLMRSIPLVMVILWFYLLMPLLIGRPIGVSLSAIITFIAFESAFFAEIVRAGIQSVSKGQDLAGKALGMTYSQVMKTIILPQAFRNMIPVFMTQTIVLFQDTSLVYAIGAYDLLKGFTIAGKNFGRPIESYLMAAITYFVICFTLSKIVRKIQTKIAIIR